MMNEFCRNANVLKRVSMIRWILTAVILASAFAMTASFAMTATAQDVTLHQGGSAERLEVAPGYELHLFARGLGHISAVAQSETGTIYTADRKSGRIYRLLDRRRDGAVDIVQPLPMRFNGPSGLATIGDNLFVTDQSGLWRVVDSAERAVLVASFANAGSFGQSHPITPMDQKTIRLGLSQPGGSTRIIDIDVTSGAATTRDKRQGQIIGFARHAPLDMTAAPWVITHQDEQTYFGQTEPTVQILEARIHAVWLDWETGQAVISRDRGVYQTASTLIGLQDDVKPILLGFDAPLRPMSLLKDRRGLFVADGTGGRIWRVAKHPTDATETTLSAPTETETRPNIEIQNQNMKRSNRPELPRGSGIKRASNLPEPNE